SGLWARRGARPWPGGRGSRSPQRLGPPGSEGAGLSEDLIDAGEDPVVVAAHDRSAAETAHAREIHVQRRPTVWALLVHGASVGLGRGLGGPLEDPVLGPLIHVTVPAHDLVVRHVAVVAGAGGQDAHGDGVVGLGAGRGDDG